MREDRQTKNAATYSEADIEHPELFEILREWRSTKAKDNGVPHYQVLHQKTLIQIVVNLPNTLKALMTIKGIGKKLAERYGQELVAMVSDYRENNNIAEVILPPITEPLSNKTAAPKDQETPKIETKQFSLELFEQGLSLSQIADKRDMVISTIEGHLAHFVARGELKIDRLLASEKQQIIEEKLQQLPGRKLSEIKIALGSDYNYGEIKFVQAHLQRLARGNQPR
jgi:ribonuclease D